MKAISVCRRLLAAVIALSAASAWSATPIAPGGSASVTVFGSTEIYKIFGHASESGTGTDAIDLTFAAGSGNIFTFGATGTVGCCGSVNSSFTPDGNSGGASVTSTNSGLSNGQGNSQIPLVGVFVNTDPFGQVPPAALAYDAANPTDLSPLLNQVFYIGDGRSGFNNAGGTILTFTAPTAATHLFLGVFDAFGFGGTSATYNDNPGSFAVSVNMLNVAAVPEPSTYALMLGGLGLVAFAARRRRPHA